MENFVSARKQDGSYYKTSLTCIRAAIQRHLRNYRKLFSIIGSPEFRESNETLNSFLKSLGNSGKTRPKQYKPALIKKSLKSCLFSYNERPSLEQFCAMSTALNDFIDSNYRQIIPSTTTSLMSPAVFTSFKTKSAVLVSSQWKFFHSGKYRPCSVVQSQSFTPGFISGGSFVNCTFNFNFNRS